MGGLVQTSSTDWCAWTGGKPKADWSGLDSTAVQTPSDDYQYRPTSPGSSQKSTKYRETGLDTKFGRDDHLLDFIDSVKEYLVRTGMDTIAYLPDPTDSTKMICILDQYSKYDLQPAISSARSLSLKFDRYDRNNDNSAKLWLLDSISDDLKKEIKDRLTQSDGFAAHWLQLIHQIQSVSFNRFAGVKNDIEHNLTIFAFPGQNVKLLATAFLDKARELDNHGYYEHRLTLVMLDRFLEAGGSNNDVGTLQYRSELLTLRSKLDKALVKVGRLASAAQDAHMASETLTYRDICWAAEEEWRKLADDGKWGPAKTKRDSRAVPPKFGANLACQPINASGTDASLLQALALIQQQLQDIKKSPSSSPCNICGKLGHWARDCPDKTKKGGKKDGSSDPPKPSWKKLPPAKTTGCTKTTDSSGQELWKLRRNDRDFFWCAKCNRWTTTHSTSTHKDKAKNQTYLAAAGSHVDVGDWPCAFPCVWTGDSRAIDSGFFPTLWDILGCHLPAIFAICVFFCGFWVSFAPALWLIVGFIVGFGPGRFFKPAYWPRAYRRHFKRRHGVSLPNPRDVSVRFSRLLNEFLRNHAAGVLKCEHPKTRSRRKKKKVGRLHSASLQSCCDTIAHSKSHCSAKRQARLSSRKNGFPKAHFRRLKVPLHFPPITTRNNPATATPYHVYDFFACTLRSALAYPQALYSQIKQSSTFPIIWDSGASVCLSFDKADFVGPLQAPTTHQRCQGITKGLKIDGVGHVAWAVPDSTGMLRTLKIPALYCPKSNVRLLSTTALLRAYPSETITMEYNRLVLSGSEATTTKPKTNSVVVAVNPSNNLPTSIGHHVDSIQSMPQALNATVSSVHHHNLNLSPAEKEWLKWHYKLGHVGFKRIQFLMSSGILAKSPRMRALHTTISKLQHPPKCAACQFAKARRRSPPQNRTHTKISTTNGSLKRDTLFPGEEISVDHYVCSTLGRLYTGFGKGSDSQMYKGGSLFVDNATSYVHVEHQQALTSHETLKAKENFEFMCRDYGVTPQKYLADNEASFTSREFEAHLQKFEQTIRFAGVGAHHHNGIAEKAIQDIMSIARTMLLHAAIHWPDMADAQLWPMAVDHAVRLHNHMPDPSTGLTPHDLFTRSRWPHSKYHDFHVWGSPAYVLDKRIADGHKLPKWEPKSQRHVNMGFSPKHASTVPLVLNPSTGSLTGQYHVVFDDWFQTVTSSVDSLPDFNSPEWFQLFGDSSLQFPSDYLGYDYWERDTGPILSPSDSPPPVSHSMDSHDVEASPYVRPEPPARHEGYRRPEPSVKPAPVASVNPSAIPSPFEREKHRGASQKRDESPVSRPIPPAKAPDIAISDANPNYANKPKLNNSLSRPGLVKQLADYNTKGQKESPVEGKRQRKQRETFTFNAVEHLFDEAYEHETTVPDDFEFLFHKTDLPTWNESRQRFEDNGTSPFEHTDSLTPDSPCYVPFKSTTSLQDHVLKASNYKGPSTTGYYNVPSAYLGYKPNTAPKLYLHQIDIPLETLFGKASVHDPDTLTWDEAMSESPENVKQWMGAANKEIAALEGKHAWDEEALANATTKVIPGTWVFRRKRDPEGNITKWKARWVIRGDLQDVDFSVYAPVVNWSTVRIFMVLSLLLGWTMKALDFANAFIQATLEDTVYVHLPRGFRSMMETQSGKPACLRLRKSVYGLKIAPKLWYLHMAKGLKELGFKPSSYDKCLLFREGALLVTFVDDCGLAVKDPKMINWFVDELRKRGFELDVEGDFTAFLGVAMERLPDGTIHMHQRGLIKKIIAAAQMEDSNPNWTPASQAGLGSDKDGELYDNRPWKYSSIVGMLLYLSTNTRMDIAFAVSQVARYNKEPRRSHASAVKTIIRYLKRTSDKGTIIKFTGKLDLVCYVDADHAGLFGREDPRNPDSARSRSGYIIMLGGVPLTWKSQLMTAICLSTLESEYQSLSLAMKQVIALKLLLEELTVFFKLDGLHARISARVFEDNAGALAVATNQRLTSRTKYFHVKWHHFWSHIGRVEDGMIAIEKIESREQAADYLTKGLARELFEHNRQLVQGW